MIRLLILAAAISFTPALQQVQSPTYARGDVVRLTPQANGDPYPDSRVIAVGGDRFHADKSGILVNGETVSDVSADLLAQLAEPWDQVIPAQHYFVIGERQDNTSTVWYFGLIPAGKITRKVR